jgi:magnesium-transporting ATPase (P-type)
VEFTVHHKIEFSSERKRMTVVLEPKSDQGTSLSESDSVIVYSKGADSVIIDSCTTQKSQVYMEKVNKHLDAFSNEGFRTLAFSLKRWQMTDFKNWMN